MGEQGEVVMIYVPCGSEEEAASIAGALLDAGLIACGNIYASRSLYRWEGRLADAQEQVLICKTAPSRARAAEKRIRELHSYTTPCIIELAPARANYEFASWVQAQVSGGVANATAPTSVDGTALPAATK